MAGVAVAAGNACTDMVFAWRDSMGNYCESYSLNQVWYMFPYCAESEVI